MSEPENSPALIAIVGPTASGKSQLALVLARGRGEIVSCDSLQVYKHFDIGSAKPSPAEQREVRHHLIDVVEPDARFSAAEYQRRARSAIKDIVGRRALPLVAGGTGLYLRALLSGLFEGAAADEPLRRRLGALAVRHGDTRLHRLLGRRDPEAAARISPRDRIRVIRALEVVLLTGRSISEHQRQPSRGTLEGFDVLVVGLAPDRAALKAAVERRTRRMLEAGLVDEVRGLLSRGYSPDLRPFKAIGYRQALAVVRGELTLGAAERDIVTQTMRYAKRQMTWFRHQVNARWYRAPDEACEAALSFLAQGVRR